MDYHGKTKTGLFTIVMTQRFTFVWNEQTFKKSRFFALVYKPSRKRCLYVQCYSLRPYNISLFDFSLRLSLPIARKILRFALSYPIKLKLIGVIFRVTTYCMHKCRMLLHCVTWLIVINLIPGVYNPSFSPRQNNEWIYSQHSW